MYRLYMYLPLYFFHIGVVRKPFFEEVGELVNIVIDDETKPPRSAELGQPPAFSVSARPLRRRFSELARAAAA